MVKRYKTYRNTLRQVIRTPEELFFIEMIEKCKDPKQDRNILSTELGVKKCSRSLPAVIPGPQIPEPELNRANNVFTFMGKNMHLKGL